MNLDDARSAPLAGGTGLACRFPGVALFCAARQPADAVADLIGRCRRAAMSESPGGPLARQLAGMLAAAEPSAVLPFAVVSSTTDGIAVLVCGRVDVDITSDRGSETLSAATSITWVDRHLVGEYTTLAIHPTGAIVEQGAPDADLIEGIVPASGLYLEARGAGLPRGFEAVSSASTTGARATAGSDAGPMAPTSEPPGVAAASRRDAPAPSAKPAPAASIEPTVGLVMEPPPDTPPSIEEDGPSFDDAAFESVLLHGDDARRDLDNVVKRDPLPVEPDPSEIRAAESDTGDVLVQGVVCSRGHFNDPRSRFCSSCGISMVHQTLSLVPGPRPPLGVIVFEDGTTYSLSASYVVGRQPDSSSRVQRGEALPLTLEDSERTISRVHAELRLQDWDVHFVNLSSTNGSFVWDPGNEQWLPVTDQPVVLTPGTRIAFGRRTAVFESALVR